MVHCMRLQGADGKTAPINAPDILIIDRKYFLFILLLSTDLSSPTGWFNLSASFGCRAKCTQSKPYVLLTRPCQCHDMSFFNTKIISQQKRLYLIYCLLMLKCGSLNKQNGLLWKDCLEDSNYRLFRYFC